VVEEEEEMEEKEKEETALEAIHSQTVSQRATACTHACSEEVHTRASVQCDITAARLGISTAVRGPYLARMLGKE
jgi:hypothetical protein